MVGFQSLLIAPAPLSTGVIRQKTWDRCMPPKIRDIIADLEKAGFVNRGGKGSHRNYVHPMVIKPITVSGNLGDDAKQYQIKAVRLALQEAKK